MAAEFFNFGNNETFHFFKWICKNVSSGPEALISDAFKSAEKPGDDEIPGEEICWIVRNRLAEKLTEILYEAAPDLEDMEIGIVWMEEGEPSVNSLLLPILAHAFARIDCDVVAEALLVQAGKWNPDKQRPEIL